MQTEATITCALCGTQARETMPEKRLPAVLRPYRLRGEAEAEGWGLLRVLLLLGHRVPAEAILIG